MIVNTTQNVNTPPIPGSAERRDSEHQRHVADADREQPEHYRHQRRADYCSIQPVAGNCTAAPFNVPIFGSCTVTILFTPSALGDRAATLNIVSNAPGLQPAAGPARRDRCVPARPVQGYWLVGSDGGVFAFGAAHYYGSLGNLKLNKPVVGMASTPPTAARATGWWPPTVASSPSVTSPVLRLDRQLGAQQADRRQYGISAWTAGGYFGVVASDGGIFAFGDAVFYGSVPGVLKPGQVLNKPIVAMTKTPGWHGLPARRF